ncbi:hypothetical protein [Terrabacter carboxydivorans]|uniref:Uncharacterized protein n=1 Tax=Terrabacter carboxydivorans TaxID=619730 RepID=A0ABN3LMU6_9MICO
MALQRGRVPAGAAALLAVCLALPSALAPTWTLTTLDSSRGVLLFDQEFWSWGRSRVTGAGGAVVQDLSNPVGLAVLVTLLVGALVGVTLWVLVRAPWATAVASVAWAALLGHLVSAVAERAGRPVRDDVHGLAATGASTTAGVLESLAALAAVVAVVLLVLALVGVRMPSAWVARVRALATPQDDDRPVTPGQSVESGAALAPPTASWLPAPERSAPEPSPGVAAARQVESRVGLAASQHSAPEPSPGAAADRPVDSRVGLPLRVAVAVLGGVGVLLAAATAVWPTTVLAMRVPEVGDFTKGYEQRVWAWGRQVVYSSDGVVLDAFGGPDPVSRLVLLVVVLVLAAAGLLGWLLMADRRGQVAGAAGLALALATVTGSVVARVSFDDRSIGLAPGLVEVTTVAGWLEVVSVGLLGLALVVLVAPVLLPGPAYALGARVSTVAARWAGRRGSLPEGAPPSRGTRGRSSTGDVATLREAAPPGSTHTPSVGFSDDEPRGGRPG